MIVGVGFDLVSIARVEAMLARKEQRALDRLFTAHEQEYALSRARPAMHLSARLAAKEAVFKALTGSDEAKLIGWKEAEVRRGAGIACWDRPVTTPRARRSTRPRS